MTIDDERPRRSLLRWIGWFGAFNAAVFGLVASRFLLIYDFPDDWLGILYTVLAFIGQFALLACVPMFVVLAPLALLLPSRALIMSLGVLFMSLGLSLLFLDTNVFAEHRIHLSMLTAQLFETTTWVFTGILFVIFVAFESMLAGIVWRNFATAGGPRGGRWLAAALCGCWLGGTAIHIWSDATGYTPVTQFTRFMPLYFPIKAKRDLARLGLVDPEKVQQQRMLRGSLGGAEGQLRYPLQPMQCDARREELPNIVVILLDALRPDAIHPGLMPNLARFGAEEIDFREQYSGGNSSRMGVFSLFYGLPSTYWQGFYDLQRPPVLMNTIRESGYATGLFSAVGFGSPTLLDRTAFADFAILPAERHDLPVVARNTLVADQALEWFAEQSEDEPFFLYLHLDPPMDEMPADGSESLPMDDRYAGNAKAQSMWRQYRLAMQFLDRQAGRVLDALSDAGRMDDTIVIVVSDHGYEFDDNGLGHYGHASNFSGTQLRSTLLMHWPGRERGAIEYRTSHHDLPVTLLQDVFGCTNPPEDYAVGRNLFAGESWPWMMAGSYTAHAIVQPEQIIVSHPGGFVEVRDADYKPVSGADLDAGLIQDSLEAQRRFLK
ncbi:MAG: DUF3413 domain-containing protein [Gammaproteobacteria bacterium]|nr:DUF3413 domain-containing protein [Gammaproteobacteria bacterium]